MCNQACIKFCVEELSTVDLTNLHILEIGSYNVNGTVSDYLKKRNHASYLGIDMQSGPGVDEVCDVYDIVKKYGTESFDVVISTEMIEHVESWRLAINNIKKVCKPNGHILLTTRSKGFPLHGYPLDFWRFEVFDMFDIFSDFNHVNVESDSIDIGVFVHAIKPVNWKPKDLSTIKLYDIRQE